MRRATIPAVLLLWLVSTAPAAVSAPAVHFMSPFCVKASALEKSSAGKSLAALPASTLAADYAKYKTVRSAVLAEAPSAIKADLAKILAFDDVIFADLQKAGWHFSKLTPGDLKTFATKGPPLKPASDAVIAYLDKTCGLKLPLP